MKKLIALTAALSVFLCGCTANNAENTSVPSETEPAITAEQTAETASTEEPSEEPVATAETPTEESEPEPTFSSVNILCAGDNLIHSPIYNS